MDEMVGDGDKETLTAWKIKRVHQAYCEISAQG